MAYHNYIGLMSHIKPTDVSKPDVDEQL